MTVVTFPGCMTFNHEFRKNDARLPFSKTNIATSRFMYIIMQVTTSRYQYTFYYPLFNIYSLLSRRHVKKNETWSQTEIELTAQSN